MRVSPSRCGRWIATSIAPPWRSARSCANARTRSRRCAAFNSCGSATSYSRATRASLRFSAELCGVPQPLAIVRPAGVALCGRQHDLGVFDAALARVVEHEAGALVPDAGGGPIGRRRGRGATGAARDELHREVIDRHALFTLARPGHALHACACHRAAGAPPPEGTNGTRDGAHGFTGFRGGKVGTPSPWRTVRVRRRQTARNGDGGRLRPCASKGEDERRPRTRRMQDAERGRDLSQTSRKCALSSAPLSLQCMPFAQFKSMGAVRRGSGRRGRTTPMAPARDRFGIATPLCSGASPLALLRCGACRYLSSVDGAVSRGRTARA